MRVILSQRGIHGRVLGFIVKLRSEIAQGLRIHRESGAVEVRVNRGGSCDAADLYVGR